MEGFAESEPAMRKPVATAHKSERDALAAFLGSL
jgi:hypothetical protein